MQKSEIKPKAEYAFREKRAPGTPFQRVRAIENVRGNKWKVQWIEPNPGLIDYVKSGQLIAPWKDHKAYLKEEESAERLRVYNSEHGYGSDEDPVESAVQQVFESAGDGVDFYRGVLTGVPDVIDRIRVRSRMENLPQSHAAYTDRQGRLRLPFDAALDIAKRLCAAEPSTVLVGVESTEREWTRKAERGEDHIVGLLSRYRASWALIRQWAGHDDAVAQREAEIQRLERLVSDSIYALQKAGLDSEASRLRRALERH